MKPLLLALIRAYQYLASPWVGGSCRYWPTCSEYARESIERHGALRGGWLAAARLARCHPYGRGGVDPVPLQFAWQCRCARVAPGDGREPGRASAEVLRAAHGDAPVSVSPPTR